MRRVKRPVLLYGLAAGLLFVVLRLVEYRFLVVEHALAMYGGLVAAVFAVLGLALGTRLGRRPVRDATAVVDAAGPDGDVGSAEPAAPGDGPARELGITRRELEILGQIAAGLSNREIASRLFVSENTVKTHASRLFDKLGARRRTEAVRIARERGLLA
jgi:DNA-binding CsgD family transcriptional regulator